ncbi:hypothetical protein SAMN03097699_1071 [Flavobacteriaceae bacterium MAR_2010_188]|nr:hypothetical protein SAMN03097699_1071 [Flavobacteriaceae bacterium MAR_2010_188]
MPRIFQLIPLLFFLNCYNVERNCEDYETGTFKFTYEVKGKEVTTTFKRTEDLNIDYLEKGNDTASIRWINACEFIQKDINPQNKSEEQSVHFKILSTTDNSYTFEYSLAIKPTNKAHRVERGTAFKID